jgi:hypothetical protein
MRRVAEISDKKNGHRASLLRLHGKMTSLHVHASNCTCISIQETLDKLRFGARTDNSHVACIIKDDVYTSVNCCFSIYCLDPDVRWTLFQRRRSPTDRPARISAHDAFGAV